MDATIPGTGRIGLAEGAGGLASGRLIRDLFLPSFDDPRLAKLDDGARLDLGGGLVISTDGFVVDPLFFPGGDIGKLAVAGTVNDVAMCGAVPEALAVALVIEEGLERELLARVIASMAAEARAAGVAIVTGDTKVVPRAKADKLFVTTTGIGRLMDGVDVSGTRARPGDAVLVSGPLGDHGATIMALRAGLDPSAGLRSDCTSLAGAVTALAGQVPGLHVLRDPTRGGLVASLAEIAAASAVGIALDEAAIPVADGTKTACELLGLDPLGLACEGRIVVVVEAAWADRALAMMAERPECPAPTAIGRITDEHPGRLVLRTRVGGQRVLDRAEGEALPRIC